MHCFGVINAHGVIIVSAGAVSNYKLTHVIWIYKLCMAEEGGRRGGESATTQIHTKVRYGGIPPPLPIWIDLGTIGSRPEPKSKQTAPSGVPLVWEESLQQVKGDS